MKAETQTRRYSKATIKQARLDCSRAMARARYCPDRSTVLELQCVDDREETELKFGNQLWYFQSHGVDHDNRVHHLFGVVEYSLQYGISELVEDGVFDSEEQREKFRHLYEKEVVRPTWEHPAHRFLAAGLIAVMSIWLVFLLLTKLTV